MVVADRAGAVIGFIDAERGELTGLFVLPKSVGAGFGARLLRVGIETARVDHRGPMRVEATLNAECFYRRQGFCRIDVANFSHWLGGTRVKIGVMEL